MEPTSLRSTTEQFVLQHLKVVSRSGDEWSVLCPSHGDRNASMRINIAKGKFFCHGCHIRGGMKTLARIVGARWTYDPQEARFEMVLAKLAKLREVDVTQRVRVLPESTLDRYKDVPTDYWAQTRGFTQDTIDAFDLGYDPIEDAAIIPVRDIEGRLLGVTRRYLDPDAHLKYRDAKGFRKADNLFASWMAAADESPTVVLTEGPLDAVKVWQAGHAAVAQFGSYITPRQIRLLRILGTLEIVLFYDHDEGGRKAVQYARGWSTDASGKIAYDPTHDLRKWFVVKRVRYNTSKKDPGALDSKTIDRYITEAVRLR